MFNTPQLKDRAVETTCSNLIIAGILLPPEVPKYMGYVAKMNDNDLVMEFVNSRLLMDEYYQQYAEARRN